MNPHILRQLQRGKRTVTLANEHFHLSAYGYPFSPPKTYVAEIITRPLKHAIPPGHPLVVGPSQDAFIPIEKSKPRKVYVQCESHHS